MVNRFISTDYIEDKLIQSPFVHLSCNCSLLLCLSDILEADHCCSHCPPHPLCFVTMIPKIELPEAN